MFLWFAPCGLCWLMVDCYLFVVLVLYEFVVFICIMCFCGVFISVWRELCCFRLRVCECVFFVGFG